MDVVIRDLGKRLREFRPARRRTLEEVADDTGLTPGYLSQIETGEAVPSLSALAAIAASMGTDMTAFFPFNDGSGVRVSRVGDPDRLRISPTSGRGIRAPDGGLARRRLPAGPGAPLARAPHGGRLGGDGREPGAARRPLSAGFRPASAGRREAGSDHRR